MAMYLNQELLLQSNSVNHKPDINQLYSIISDTDLFLSDTKGTHRLIGLKYDSKCMKEPLITIVCFGNVIPTAKWLVVILGKHIYVRNSFSAKLFSKYCRGQKIQPEDYQDAAEIFALFFGRR